MRLFISLSYSIMLFFISLTAFAAEKLVVHDAWIPEMPPVSRVHAGLAILHNFTNEEIKIVSVSSKEYGSIEMHLSKEVDGIARMIPQKSLVVEANGTLELIHGSYHLMMFKPARKLKAGDKVTLTFTFSDGNTQTISAEVRK